MTLASLSLRARVSILVAAAIIGVLSVAAWVIDARVDSELEKRFDTTLAARVQALATMTHREPHGIEFDVADAPRVVHDPRVSIWYTLSCDGHVISASPKSAATLLPTIPSTADSPAIEDAQIRGLGLARQATLSFHPELGDGWPPGSSSSRAASSTCIVILAQERRRLDVTLDAVDAILVGSILVALITVLVLTPPLVRAGLLPLRGLSDAMRNIGPHAPGQRLDIPPTPELVPLQARFNEVLARMDAGLARERQFASAVAHETRTRLAELRALVDVERRYPSGRPSEAVLDEIAAIGGDLEETVSGLLLLTRLEAGIETIAPRLIDLDELVERHVARMSAALQSRGLRVSIEQRGTSSTLLADPQLLDIIIANLLGNAASHAPEGSSIEVLISQGSITISNAAPDVDAKDVAHFGERFWSTHRDDGGHMGLGLSLAGAAAFATDLEFAFALDRERRLHATLRRTLQSKHTLSTA